MSKRTANAEENNNVIIEVAQGQVIEADHQIEHNANTGVTTITTQVTIRQAAQQAVDETGAEGSFSVVVNHPDNTSESFDGPDSPGLFQKNPETGRVEERPLPAGSTVSVERSARGAWRRS